MELFLVEQINQNSELSDTRSTRSKNKGKNATESTSPEDITETDADLIEKSNIGLNLDNPISNTPTIMQPVVRLQRISSEVIIYN